MYWKKLWVFDEEGGFKRLLGINWWGLALNAVDALMSPLIFRNDLTRAAFYVEPTQWPRICLLPSLAALPL